MTINTAVSEVIVQGNGVTSTFNYAFLIPNASEAVVLYDNGLGLVVQLNPSLYTISGINNPLGGTVTFPLVGSPIAIGTSLTIKRVLPFLQTVRISNQGAFYPHVVETALDYLMMCIQQLDDQGTHEGGGGGPDVDRIFPFINVLEYGAKGDGVTNDTAAIQAALTAGGTLKQDVWAPYGDYLCAGGVVINNPGVKLFGDGIGKTRFLKSGLKNLFSAKGVAFANGTNNTLASNVGAGARSVTLGAGFGAQFAVGQICMLKDEGGWAGLAAAPPRNGEFVTIQAVVGDVITFWRTIRLSYTTANTARLIALTQLPGVAYSDFTVVMDDTQNPVNLGLTGPTPADPDSYGFAFFNRGLFRPRYNNIEITNALAAGIALTGCLGADIDEYAASNFGSATTGTGDPTSTLGTGGFGYGISELELNEGLVASNLNFERIRHGYTCGAGNNFYGNAGVPTGSLICNGIHREAKDMAWDTHNFGDGIAFENLKALGGRACGFQIRSRRSRVIGCSAEEQAAAGLWIRGGGGTGVYGNECFVSGFQAMRTNLVDGYPASLGWTDYGCIVDDGDDTTIVGADISHCGGPLLTMGAFHAPLRASYHDMRGNFLCAITVTNTYGVHAMAIGASGRAKIEGLEIRVPDSRLSHLVYRDTAGDQIELNNVWGVGNTGDVFQSATDDGYIDSSVIITNSELPYAWQIPGPRFLDHFLGKTLLTAWATAKGSDGACAFVANIPGTAGIGRGTTGANAGGTMALNGSQLSGELNWKASQSGLVIDARVKISNVAGVSYFFGLTDQNSALEAPFTMAGGDVLTSNASDAVGFLFDTNADTDNIWLVGVKADVDATKQNSGVAPTSGAWERYRIVITSGGSATFYRNGVRIGTQMANAVTTTAALCPVFSAFSTGAAARNMDLDWVLVEETINTAIA